MAEAAFSFRHKAESFTLWTDPILLLDILARTTSSKWRDKVYALLSLGSPSLRNVIKPDYNKPAVHVFAEATCAVISFNCSFDLLVFSRTQTLAGSSWICDFEKSTLSTSLGDEFWRDRKKLESFQDQLKRVMSRRPLHTTLRVSCKPGYHAMLITGRVLDRIEIASGWSLPHHATASSLAGPSESSSDITSDLRTTRDIDDFSALQKRLPLAEHRLLQKASSSAASPGNQSPDILLAQQRTIPGTNKGETSTSHAERLEEWFTHVLDDLGSNAPFQRITSQLPAKQSMQTRQGLEDILKQANDPLQTITGVFEEWRSRISSRFKLDLPPLRLELQDINVWLSYLDCDSIFFTGAGFLCLAPSRAETGDLLFLPNGGFAPMLIRQKPGTNGLKSIGFVYVNGIMDQELEVTGIGQGLKELTACLQ